MISKYIFSEISEGDYAKIFFNPPLEISYFYDPEKDYIANIDFDFGLNVDIGYNSFITDEYKTIEEKILKTIEFELFHAFMHYNGDPNYSTLNWALFGNLAFRVKCVEDYGYYKETWTYKIINNLLNKIIENES
jgi:hypothetical protein